MKRFENYDDAVRYIHQYIGSQFDLSRGPGRAFTASDKEPPSLPEKYPWSASIHDKYRVFYRPKDPFLGFFNKVLVEGQGQHRAYTFSLAEKLDRRALRDLTKTTQRHFPQAKCVYLPGQPDGTEDETGNASGREMATRIWDLVHAVFSDAFLDAEQLSKNTLQDRLDALIHQLGDGEGNKPIRAANLDDGPPSLEILREGLDALQNTGGEDEENQFWDEFLQADLSDDRTAELLDAYFTPPARDVGQDTVAAIKLPALRIEETRGDLRIILLVIPTDLTTKLTYYAPASDAMLENPVTEYFWKYANPYAMARLAKHSNVDFIELQGWPSYPMSSYNVQKFAIDFGCYNVNGHPIDLLIGSGKRQFRTLYPLLGLLYLHAGADWKGRLGELLPSEITEFTLSALGDELLEKFGPAYADKIIRIYSGFRIYSMPLYDVIVNGHTREYEDDKYRPFLAAGLSVTVIPYLRETRPDRGVFAHEIVDESNK